MKGTTEVPTDYQGSTDHLVEGLFDLWRWLRQVSHSLLEGEATPQQFWLLHQLGRRGALTVGEAATALGVSQSSATTACKRLEIAGLIKRSRRLTDERIVEISLTEHGRCIVEGWRQRRRLAVTELIEPLDPQERDELRQLVTRVLSLAESSGALPARQP